MELEELQRVREAERSTDSLQHLENDFYQAVGEYLEDLRERRDAMAAETADPFTDPDVRQVSDELKTAQRIVESLYERRVGKIVKSASFAAADMQAEKEGLTSEEQVLFDAIVTDIQENRNQVLGMLDPEAETNFADPPRAEPDTGMESGVEEPNETATPRGDPAGTTASEPDDGAGATEINQERSTDVDRTTVRITEDVGEIVGVDEHAYELAADDIVSLPTDNAQPLIERGVATVIE